MQNKIIDEANFEFKPPESRWQRTSLTPRAWIAVMPNGPRARVIVPVVRTNPVWARLVHGDFVYAELGVPTTDCIR